MKMKVIRCDYLHKNRRNILDRYKNMVFMCVKKERDAENAYIYALFRKPTQTILKLIIPKKDYRNWHKGDIGLFDINGLCYKLKNGD